MVALLALMLLAAQAESAPHRKIIVLVSVPERADSEAFDAIAMRDRVESMLKFYPRLMLERIARVELAQCGSKMPCIAQSLREQNVDYALLIAANGATGVVTSRLLDVDTAEIVGQELEVVLPAEVDILLEAQVERLLRALGYAAGGRLILEMFPVDAVVSIDAGLPVPGPIPPQILKAGAHKLAARREGYEAREMRFELRPYQEENVTLTLESAGSSFLQSPWFWVGVGVVCIGGAVGAALALSGNPSRFGPD